MSAPSGLRRCPVCGHPYDGMVVTEKGIDWTCQGCGQVHYERPLPSPDAIMSHYEEQESWARRVNTQMAEKKRENRFVSRLRDMDARLKE